MPNQPAVYPPGQEPRPSSPHPEAHRGVLILALGILGLVSCTLLSALAWILGNRDLELMRDGAMDREGLELTQAGRMLGIIGVVFHVVVLLLILATAVGLITLFRFLF